MDALTFRFVVRVLEMAHEREVERWRRSRFVAYVSAAAMGAKVRKPSDLMSLPGDAAPVGDVDYWREVLAEEKRNKVALDREQRILQRLQDARRQN